MEEKLVTLAILTYSKAQILKTVLEGEGIETFIHNVNLVEPVISSGVRVRIKESDLPHALQIVESASWLSEEVDALGNTEKKRGDHILIPIDFSEYSLKVCHFGFDLAKKLNAEVVFLHVYFAPIYMPTLQYESGMSLDTPDFGEKIDTRGQVTAIHEKLKGFAEKVDKEMADGTLPKVKYCCLLREGIPEEEILTYAEDEKPRAIIMGTRGEGQKHLDLIGSVTAEVIERSPVYVYAIPDDAQSLLVDDIKKIAIFTSFDQRDLIAFDSLIRTWGGKHFEVSFIHISSHEEKWAWNEVKLAGIQDYFKRLYPDIEFGYFQISDNNLSEETDRLIREQGIDVICVTHYKRNIFARLFRPGIARKMLFHSHTPLLAIK
jgi:nucleotide-binding universal stress UspA family protein